MEEKIGYSGHFLKVGLADAVFGIVFCVGNDEELSVLQKHADAHSITVTKADVDDSDGNMLYIVSDYYGKKEGRKIMVTEFLKEIAETKLWMASAKLSRSDELSLIVFINTSKIANDIEKAMLS